MPHLLFIAPEDMSEAVLAAAAYEAALAAVPGAAATIVCAPEARDLYRAAPGLKSLRAWDASEGFAPWLTLAWSKARAPFDLVVDLRNAPASYAVRAKRRIRRRSSRLLRHRLEDFAALFGDERLAPRLWLDDAAREAAAAFASDGPLLVLAPGAESDSKTWPGERFAAVARRLVGGAGPLSGARVIVLGEAERTRSVAASLDADGVPALDAAGKLDLLASAALLERATLLIANANPLMQIGAAMGAPTLGLFGPTDERVFGPTGPRSRALRGRAYEEIMALEHAGLDARPLMDDLSVDAVEAAALDLLHAGGLS
jgi:ADP-heptose:LPS heptosyltransferase